MTTAKKSGLAIAGLVCGIIGICFPLLAPVAVILGIIALNKIKSSGGEQTGEGLAIASIVLGGIACVMIPVLAAIAIPNFIRYQLRSKQSEARSNLAAIRTSAEMYQANEGKYLPSDGAWTPADPCPTEGCQLDPSLWSQPPWSELGYKPYSKHYFQYRYQSDGDTYTIEARADLDGDGEFGLFTTRSGQTSVDSTPGKF